MKYGLDSCTLPQGDSAHYILRFPGRARMELQTENNHFTIQTIRELREIENSKDVWKSWQQNRDSDPDFFSLMVRARSNGCTPHVVVLSRNGRPDALLVGLSDHTKVPIKFGSVTVWQPEFRVLEFVRGGLLGNASKENCDALIREVMRSLHEGEAELAFWEHLDVESPLFGCAVQHPNIILRDHYPCPRDRWLMSVPKDLDTFFHCLGPSQRSKLRRKYKKVLHDFPERMKVRSFRTSAELDDAIAHMERIARQSVKRQLGFGFFDTPPTRLQLMGEATQGWLRIYILYLDEIPVAFWQGTLYDRTLEAEHVGFDPAWSALSPGIFLFLNILENLHCENVESIDFGCGNGQLYKCLGLVRRPEARVQICAPKLRALQLHLLQTLTHYVTHLIQGTSCLNWARRAFWKRRKAAALARSEARLQMSPHSRQEVGHFS